ncbi:MAG: cytochrome c oxidase subunit II [Bacteroidales bacterium]|nr:cytochrome c oxidase subunit II [Bacteroidales bacterium]
MNILLSSGASNFVRGVDTSFAVILGISLFFLIGITGVMIYFVIRYRKRHHPEASQIRGNNKLEIIWTVIPTLLVLVMFWYGWTGYRPMRNIPADAIPIKVTAQMWSWNFEYANGKVSDSLVVPLNQAVKLDLFSRDVLHSLYIPAFRIKEDVVPGKNNKMWFIGQEEGSYDILCAEYCGLRHAYMLSKVVVIPEQEYYEWLADTTSVGGDEHPGLTVIKTNACISCHSLDGSRLVGPSFRGIWGRREQVVNPEGEEITVTVDGDYIRRAIYEPNAEVVKGYNKGLMISYKELISEEELTRLTEYLQTLQ